MHCKHRAVQLNVTRSAIDERRRVSVRFIHYACVCLCVCAYVCVFGVHFMRARRMEQEEDTSVSGSRFGWGYIVQQRIQQIAQTLHQHTLLLASSHCQRCNRMHCRGSRCRRAEILLSVRSTARRVTIYNTPAHMISVAIVAFRLNSASETESGVHRHESH